MCRMIVARADLVPLASVVPVVMAQLPLKEDHEEYPIVYREEAVQYGFFGLKNGSNTGPKTVPKCHLSVNFQFGTFLAVFRAVPFLILFDQKAA